MYSIFSEDQMSIKDICLCRAARIIIKAYNDSHKPHMFPEEKERMLLRCAWKHDSKGYHLIYLETDEVVPVEYISMIS